MCLLLLTFGRVLRHTSSGVTLMGTRFGFKLSGAQVKIQKLSNSGLPLQMIACSRKRHLQASLWMTTSHELPTCLRLQVSLIVNKECLALFAGGELARG